MSRSAAARTQHHDERALRRPRPHGAAPRAARPVPPAPPHPAARARRAPPERGSTQPAPRAARAAARRAAPALPARPPLRLAAGGAAIALRVADSALDVSGSRTMDRLVRSRAWVVIIGVGLIGIVAMQVSMLKLNSGIGRAVDTVATLERSNASLKAEVSRLSSGDRIQSLAGQRGFLMPEPADVTYLRAGDKRSDGFRAARRMRAPDPAIAGPAGAVAAARAPDARRRADAAGVAGSRRRRRRRDAPATAGRRPPPGTTAAPPTTDPAATAAPQRRRRPAATTTPRRRPRRRPPPPPARAVAPAPAAPPTNAAGGVTTP